MILILATIIIQNDFGQREPPYASEFDSQVYKNDPIYAKTDWKVQKMLEAIAIAREEKSAVQERLMNVGIMLITALQT